MANDVMVGYHNDGLMNFLTKEDMKKKAPFIFAKTKTNPALTERYVMSDTEKVIDELASKGWGVVDCKQQRPNKRSNIRSLHMVVFQNPNIRVVNKDENGNVVSVEAFPRIILTNSHDGFHACKIMVGLFRCVCSNGLVIASKTFADFSIRHTEEIYGIVAKAIEVISDNLSVMDEMRSTMLTDEQKCELATTALRLRSGVKEDEKFNVTDEDVEDILAPVRTEDEGNDLWSVFNVLQEKVIKGNFMTVSKTNGRKRKARAIKGISKDLEINQGLFLAASEYRIAA